MAATSPRIHLPWAAVRVPLLVVVGIVLAVAAAVAITVLSVRPAPAQTVPTGHLPLHSTTDTCSGVHPGFEC